MARGRHGYRQVTFVELYKDHHSLSAELGRSKYEEYRARGIEPDIYYSLKRGYLVVDPHELLPRELLD